MRIITLRERAGLGTELDVQQATYILGQTESMLPVLDAGRRRAQNRLCILMAKPPQDLEQIANRSGTIPIPPPDIIVGIPAELLRRRPDVQQAERAAALQSARIGIAEAEFYPHIAITGTIGVQAQDFSNLFSSQSLVGQIGPGFNWNLLNYGRIQNNVRAQDARFQQAVFSYRDTVLRATRRSKTASSPSSTSKIAWLRSPEAPTPPRDPLKSPHSNMKRERSTISRSWTPNECSCNSKTRWPKAAD